MSRRPGKSGRAREGAPLPENRDPSLRETGGHRLVRWPLQAPPGSGCSRISSLVMRFRAGEARDLAADEAARAWPRRHYTVTRSPAVRSRAPRSSDAGPKPTQGHALCRCALQWRSMRALIPFALWSAAITNEQMAHGLGLGAVAFLHRPRRRARGAGLSYPEPPGEHVPGHPV